MLFTDREPKFKKNKGLSQRHMAYKSEPGFQHMALWLPQIHDFPKIHDYKVNEGKSLPHSLGIEMLREIDKNVFYYKYLQS